MDNPLRGAFARSGTGRMTWRGLIWNVRAAVCRLTWPLVLLIVALLWLAGPVRAQVFESRAPQALLIDVETGTVLYEKDAETRMPPASMAKLMTLTVVFDAVASGQLALEDQFLVSENAWRRGGAGSGGSTMFLELGSEVSIDDLLHGIIVQSGNDACIVIAEGMAGTEATFAELMNQAARRLELAGSHFTNSTGLPDPDQYVTAWDLARIAMHLIKDHPDLYAIFAQESFTWNGINQSNRNPLLGMNIGADGLKTGFTEESGYGLTGSAVRDGQRLLVVLNGMESARERAEEARKLLEWGFRAFGKVTLFPGREAIGEASVFGGAKGTVEVVSRRGIDLLLPLGTDDLLRGRVVYDGPIRAPIDEGQAIGTLRIELDGRVIMEAPVEAGENIEQGTFQQRATDGLGELLFGWF